MIVREIPAVIPPQEARDSCLLAAWWPAIPGETRKTVSVAGQTQRPRRLPHRSSPRRPLRRPAMQSLRRRTSQHRRRQTRQHQRRPGVSPDLHTRPQAALPVTAGPGWSGRRAFCRHRLPGKATVMGPDGHHAPRVLLHPAGVQALTPSLLLRPVRSLRLHWPAHCQAHKFPVSMPVPSTRYYRSVWIRLHATHRGTHLPHSKKSASNQNSVSLNPVQCSRQVEHHTHSTTPASCSRQVEHPNPSISSSKTLQPTDP